MKLAYEAANSIEGHMILNLLEQSGLTARIDGEYLQGGMGELPAAGLVRVMIDEADYEEARLLILQWERDETTAEETTPEIKISKKRGSFGPLAVAFFAGLALAVVYFRTPITEDGVDYNGDGKLDETYTYVNYLISEVSQDRNFDGKIDVIHSYSSRGLIESSISDEDFDGKFETETTYEKGNVYRTVSDTTGDDKFDYRADFVLGVLDRETFLNPDTGKPIKIKHFSPLRLDYSLIDTTGDGILDTRHDYDANEEITERSLK